VSLNQLVIVIYGQMPSSQSLAFHISQSRMAFIEISTIDNGFYS